MLGRITRFNDRLGYGIIEDDSGEEHFLHINNVSGSRSLSPGDIVCFTPHLDKGHKRTASAVRILQIPTQHETLGEISEWRREASLEDNTRYFYYTDDVGRLVDGSRQYVVGRKGTGKTAIAEHLLGLQSFDTFVKKISFKNYPFNELYSLSNNAFKPPNQYITMWKYLIYSVICQLMAQNENVSPEIRRTLLSIYPLHPERALDSNVKEWTSAKIALTVLGTGGSVDVTRAKSDNALPIAARVEILERCIVDHIDDSRYLIIFDELDEDYNCVN